MFFFLCSNPYSRRPPSRRGDRGSSRGDIKSRLGRVPDGATGSQGNKSDWYKVVVGIKIICVHIKSRLGRVPDGATGSQGNKSDWYKVVVGIKIICVQLQLLIFIILFLPYFGFGDLT